jgi:hypothetical protein
MNRIARTCAIIVLVANPLWADDAHAQLPKEIEITHELRTAFYEHAPRALAAAMSKVVVSWCSSDRSEPDSDAVRWLCRGQELVYFRNVYVNGVKGSHGLVCENNGTSALKYFGVDLAADVATDGSCVRAKFDGSVYELYVGEVGDDDA